jgi:hypothetical protein
MSTQDADTRGVPEPPAKVVAVADQIASVVDHAVPVSDEPANRVLVDNARLVRWAAPAFVICSLMLLPWIAVLGTTLPQRQLSQHYRLAWTGYDVLLALGLAGTAVAALRRSRLLPIAGSATGALLVADAWFDVLTSSGGRDIAEAVAMSVLAELPLAFVCFWLAVHSQDVAEQRLLLLLKGRRDPATANGRVPSRTRDKDDDPLPAGDDTTDAGGRARQTGA